MRYQVTHHRQHLIVREVVGVEDLTPYQLVRKIAEGKFQHLKLEDNEGNIYTAERIDE